MVAAESPDPPTRSVFAEEVDAREARDRLARRHLQQPWAQRFSSSELGSNPSDQHSNALAGLAGQSRDILVGELAVPDRTLGDLLCDIEGLDYEGIAHVLDCPVGTVRSRIHHARKRLKAALAGYARTRGYRDVESHG